MSTTTPQPLADIDPTVRPQDDLYRFTNGTWLKRTEIPSDRSSWGASSMLAEQARAHVRTIVESQPADAAPGTTEQQIHDLYASFMDTDRIESLGFAPLRERLARVEQIVDVETLATFWGWMLRHGYTAPLDLFVDVDLDDPSLNVWWASQDGLGLPDEAYYRKPEHAQILTAYRRHVEDMFALCGVDDAAEQADLVLALETEIAAAHWDIVACRDIVRSYNPMTLSAWEESAPALPLRATVTAAGVDAEAMGAIVVNQPSFFTALAPLVAPERLPQWRAWARWHLIAELAPLLHDEVSDARFAFAGTTLRGIPVQQERWKRAIAFVERGVDEAVGKLYVERHFPPQAKAKVEELVAHVTQAYGQSIRALEWMTDATKAEALDKLSKFRAKIGYPEVWRDYSALVVSPDDLVGNAENIAAFTLDFHRSKAGQPVDPTEWEMPPQMVNAYYHPMRNEVVFPAAILQLPFFDVDADDAINYGGIGATIGHELGHGFDDEGSSCDGDGRLRDWWSDADRAAFEEQTAVLVRQFDALVPEGLTTHVNGELTLGENIGDVGGLKIAFLAWQLATAGTEIPEIDGLTGAQRFFAAYAASWLEKTRPEYMAVRLASDPHSPEEFRCNQIVRNLDAFHEAFGVTPADGMWLDPSERVTIW